MILVIKNIVRLIVRKLEVERVNSKWHNYYYSHIYYCAACSTGTGLCEKSEAIWQAWHNELEAVLGEK